MAWLQLIVLAFIAWQLGGIKRAIKNCCKEKKRIPTSMRLVVGTPQEEN